ncbi:MAG TPA: serine/threonine-protein kinase [Micropepsaceae bacterium]|nr:serine/threonine-protein kinase [Micropepsaceae bacterium]
MADEKGTGPFSGGSGVDVTQLTSGFGSAPGTDKSDSIGTAEDITRSRGAPADDATRLAGTENTGGANEALTAFRRSAEQSKIGLVLNHIWKVRRLVARGGMGEVYEGIETNTGEPVAIKFLLPRLTADPQIKELFLSEARNFVRVSKTHSALVQYRVCAEDPVLGETFIVMEFIDGPPLSETLTTLKPNLQQLVEFMRLVASALAVAHKQGLVHRDLSPRNILISGGDLARAKIIDFGIAKDLETGDATIFGGFKGNLGYCAPELFHEGGAGEAAQIGPWTDIYSLALVVLALASGKAPAMGSTFGEAIEKRKRIPDISAAPKELWPILSNMLAPNPAKRLHSMTEVLAALDEIAPKSRKRSLVPWLLAAGIVVAAGAGAATFLFPQGPSEEEVRQRVASTLAQSDCTWLGLDSLVRNGGTMQAKVSGAARDVAAATAGAQRAAAVPVAFDTAAVSSVQPQACGALNAFRRFREPASPVGPSLAVQQRLFTLGNDPRYCGEDGLRKARVTVNLRLDEPTTDFTLLGLEPNGQMQQLIADRAEFEAARARNPELAPNLGGNIYTMSFCVDEATAARSNKQGAVGLVMVKGQGPFALGFDPNAHDSVAAPQDWPETFGRLASARHWLTQIAWYQIVSK